jgi:RHS repeat-associated protein
VCRRRWVYRWNPPSTPAYQPASASALDAPEGYLKGVRIYTYNWDSSGTLNTELGGVEEFDYGIYYGADNRRMDYSLDFRGGLCRAITGVYKVFVDGNWLSLESGWSNNFYVDRSNPTERCPTLPQMVNTEWCNLPVCGADDIPSPTNVTAVPGPAPNQIEISWTPPASSTGLAGYYLYVNDPLWDSVTPGNEALGTGRTTALFRKNHPYLRLGSEANSVILDGLRSCRSYSFYLSSIANSGRVSAPSLTTPLRSALAAPVGEVFPADLRFRPWTGNDSTLASTDAPTRSTEVARLIQDLKCASGTLQKSADLVNWTDEGSVPMNSLDEGSYVYERHYSLPIGTTTYYRLHGVEHDSNPVAMEVFGHEVPPLSPPTHLDATFSNNEVHLHWCPSFASASDPITGYRIFRSERSGGPYQRVTDPDLSSTRYAWEDTSSVITDPNTNPTKVRYFYVIAAVRGSEVSGFSPENGAGIYLGTYWDPDTPNFNHWFTNSTPSAADLVKYCNNDYVENGPNQSNPLPSERTQEPAPYRSVGVLVIPSHLTYYHLDHLGTPRILTDINGVRVQGQHFLPFGEEMPFEGGTNTRKFTGHERDAETGLDYMMARYYQASLGRFMAVDPAASSAQAVGPQSWNRYAYAGNNPLRNLDPNGQDFMDVVNGVANGFGSSMMAGGGRLQGQNSDYQAGQTVGDAAAAIVGAVETVVGGGLVLGGTGADATGVGALVGVPAQALGSAMVLQGGAAVVTGGTNLMNSTDKPGSSGGPTAGQDFKQSVKGQAKAEATGSDGTTRCQNCGVDTGGKGDTDHIIPKSKGGDATD